MINLNTVFCGVSLSSPLLIAPSPITSSFETIKALSKLGLGGIVIKSISTLKSEKPNRRNLLYDDFCLYSTGPLSGEVMDIETGARLLQYVKNQNLAAVASVLGDCKSIESWSTLIKEVNTTCADMIELNLRYSFPSPRSYPLPSEIGHDVSLDGLMAHLHKNLKFTFELCQIAKELSNKPIIVKLFPDYMTIAFAIQCEKGGADGVTLVNSLNTIAPPRLPNGGPPYHFLNEQSYSMCSGSILRPLVYKYIYEVKKATNLNISACGGISEAVHVLEAIMLGANVCQIGTAALVKGKEHLKQLVSQLCKYTDQFKLEELKGAALKHIVPADKREFFRCYAVINRKEECMKCTHCPVEAILCGAITERRSRMPQIDKTKCYGCGMCAKLCKLDNIFLLKTTE
jgi:dihydroorotate dehydrogenase/Pyruvate/2-oxoacid:ferredoxin oxidoreductase delta subunit